MGHTHPAIRGPRAIQLLLVPAPASRIGADGPKGVVYTKRWVVELLLDLAGYTADRNLVDAIAVEPSAGEGVFLAPMIERLADSCRRLGRPISDCRHSLIAYELDDPAFRGGAARARRDVPGQSEIASGYRLRSEILC
jgi:adenine-specific DNA-methyltransferase